MLLDVKQIRGLTGASLAGLATLALPDGAGVLEWTETVAAVGVVPANRIDPNLQPGADTDENSAELLDLKTISAVAGTDVIIVTVTFGERTSGPVKIYWRTF